MKKDVGSGKYTFPSRFRSAYLDGEKGETPWHTMILASLEESLSVLGADGIAIPTFQTLLSTREKVDRLRHSQFVRGLYTHVPEKRRYKRRLLRKVDSGFIFPLNFGKSEVGEEAGTYWIKHR